jgi:hypothetical protein
MLSPPLIPHNFLTTGLCVLGWAKTICVFPPVADGVVGVRGRGSGVFPSELPSFPLSIISLSPRCVHGARARSARLNSHRRSRGGLSPQIPAAGPDAVPATGPDRAGLYAQTELFARAADAVDMAIHGSVPEPHLFGAAIGIATLAYADTAGDRAAREAEAARRLEPPRTRIDPFGPQPSPWPNVGHPSSIDEHWRPRSRRRPLWVAPRAGCRHTLPQRAL